MINLIKIDFIPYLRWVLYTQDQRGLIFYKEEIEMHY